MQVIFLMTQIIASNVGGTGTLIGDPPNIMIGSAADIPFISFIIYDGPIVVITMVATIIAFKFIYKKGLSVAPEKMELIMKKALGLQKNWKKPEQTVSN